MQLNLKLALTLPLSPRRGKPLLMRGERSLMSDSNPALETLLPLLGERGRVRAVVVFYRMVTA